MCVSSSLPVNDDLSSASELIVAGLHQRGSSCEVKGQVPAGVINTTGGFKSRLLSADQAHSCEKLQQ